jgi:hypothetical protein
MNKFTKLHTLPSRWIFHLVPSMTDGIRAMKLFDNTEPTSDTRTFERVFYSKYCY